MPGSIPSFLGGYSLGMPGPVPGFGSPSPRPSLGFFKPELCEFVGVVVVVTVVACCMSRGGEFVGAVVVVTVIAWGMTSGGAFGTFYARHQERAAVLAGA